MKTAAEETRFEKEKLKLKAEAAEHLTRDIIPFWKSLRDDEMGGYYGYMDYEHNIIKDSVKGCILNSRITWFFSNAYMLLKDESLLDEARHGFDFLMNACMDRKNGGVYWSVGYDKTPAETLKHTYNQAFSVYALSSYYEASGDSRALDAAYGLVDIIENKMKDEQGYMEAFDENFVEVDNEKLSENGVMASKTMNTLLHVLEAYTELYRVDHSPEIAKRLKWILDILADKVYNPSLHRQEVFFDGSWNSIIDLHSYGHDIETSWLVDRCCEILGDKTYSDKMSAITGDLANQVYSVAFDGSSLANECENGVTDEWRIWWVQAETVVGFLNAYGKDKDERFLEAALKEWEFIMKYQLDKRTDCTNGREWYWRVTKEGIPDNKKPLAEPWKCPYHNGRMCIEICRRIS